MNSRLWLLVDWMGEGNDSTDYGIVNIDSTAYEDIAMVPGNVISIRTRHSAPRLAVIVRVSDCRNNIKKQKELLERQERQLCDGLQRCMQTINEITSENSSNFMGASRNSRDFSRFTPTFNSRHNGMPSMGTLLRDALTETTSRRIWSTSLPSSRNQQVPSLTINQTTQREMSFIPILERLLAASSTIEMLEENLHEQLLSTLSQAIENSSTSESDVRPNSNEYVQQSSGSSSSSGFVEILAEEEMESSNGGSIGVDQELPNNSNDPNPNIVRVRRVSTRTTRNNDPVRHLFDLVPLGDSHALVPRRLLNDIDWNSYSSATRRLLGACFPQSVLATHSLSRKRPAPASLNRPAERILNPAIVNDIVTTVSTRCCVERNLVRQIITTECSVEAKLYRNRHRRRRQLRQSHNNEENLQPSTSSSD